LAGQQGADHAVRPRLRGTDKWIDLGMDFSGDQGPPKGWRKGEKIEDIKGAVGGAGRVACETKDTLPKAALP
jgi:hypothetical protein